MGELAYAKINLGLSVLRRRADGYHRIHTLFATVEAADYLWLSRLPRGVHVAVEGASLPEGEGNLAYHAARLYLEAAGQPGGVRIRLEKKLPIAAGLGGGSADAAAVLRGLARLYPTKGLRLYDLACRLGTDVPFLLQGGLTEGQGRGEDLSPLPFVERGVVLVNPGLAVTAREAYQALDEEDFSGPLPIRAILDALYAGETPPYWNSLEAVVFRLYPELRVLKRTLIQEGLSAVLMSGSGSSFFGLCEGPEAALQLSKHLEARLPGCWVRPSRLILPLSANGEILGEDQ